MNRKLTSLLIAAIAMGASPATGFGGMAIPTPKGRNKRMPHQGERERARRRKQVQR